MICFLWPHCLLGPLPFASLLHQRLACVITAVRNTTSVQGIRHSCFACFFLTKIYFKYIKNVYVKLASLKNMFQYKSNDTNFTEYNQVLVALFIWSKFALKYVCALFIETDVVRIYLQQPCLWTLSPFRFTAAVPDGDWCSCAFTSQFGWLGKLPSSWGFLLFFFS
jgi:hypothetical protein